MAIAGIHRLDHQHLIHLHAPVLGDGHALLGGHQLVGIVGVYLGPLAGVELGILARFSRQLLSGHQKAWGTQGEGLTHHQQLSHVDCGDGPQIAQIHPVGTALHLLGHHGPAGGHLGDEAGIAPLDGRQPLSQQPVDPLARRRLGQGGHQAVQHGLIHPALHAGILNGLRQIGPAQTAAAVSCHQGGLGAHAIFCHLNGELGIQPLRQHYLGTAQGRLAFGVSQGFIKGLYRLSETGIVHLIEAKGRVGEQLTQLSLIHGGGDGTHLE